MIALVSDRVIVPVVGSGEENVVEPKRWVDERNLDPFLT